MKQLDADIFFLSCLVPPECREEVYKNKKGFSDEVSSDIQYKFIKGLDIFNTSPVKIINKMLVGTYPTRYNKMFILNNTFNHTSFKEHRDYNISYINLRGVLGVTIYYFIKRYLKNWAKLKGKKQKIFIAYTISNYVLQCIKYVKKIDSSIKTVVIVPDLPEFTRTAISSFLMQIKEKLFPDAIKLENCSSIDKYILFSKYMSEKLNCNNNYIVIEGVYSNFDVKSKYSNTNQDEKIITYCGSINEKYGVMNLVEAFKRINDENYKLILCGNGDCKEKIQMEASNNSRIIYKGQIRREEALKIQLQSTVLVNPRQRLEEFTRYSFPSKTIEYLGSGKPVIMYKLDGIPDEYDNYLFYVEDNSIEALKNKIIEVCSKSKDEIFEIGQRNKKFIIEEKNETVQAQKMLEYLLLK